MKDTVGVKRRHSIFVRAIFWIASITLFFIAIFTFFGLNYFVEIERQKMQAQSDIISSIQANAINTPLWDFEEEEVQKLVTALSDVPSFQAAWIETPDDKSRNFLVGTPSPIKDVIQSDYPLIFTEDDVANNQGTLILQISLKELKATEKTLTIGFSIAGLVLLSVISGAVILIVRSITSPMLSMTHTMKKLASGDFQIEIPAKERLDEVGQMAAAVEVFKENGIKMKALEIERTEREEIEQENKKKEMLLLADNFKNQIGNSLNAVTQAVQDLAENANGMNETVSMLKERTNVVDNASGIMTKNTQSVASATSQLTSSIHEISTQANSSHQISQNAQEQVSETNNQIKGLVNTTDNIGQIVNLINEIAEQTNLLALNATIESARAGDAGKGFAVVASEVKNLASQTSQATEKISQQISAVQKETSQAVASVSEVERTINQVNEVATHIAAAVEEQNTATKDISDNVKHVSREVGNVSVNMSEVNNSLENVSDRSNGVLSLSVELSKQAMELQNSVDNFLKNLAK